MSIMLAFEYPPVLKTAITTLFVRKFVTKKKETHCRSCFILHTNVPL